MHVFRDLVAEYVMACHPDDFADRPKSAPVEHGLERDSFTRYFRQDRTDEFAEAARSASLEAGSRTGESPTSMSDGHRPSSAGADAGFTGCVAGRRRTTAPARSNSTCPPNLCCSWQGRPVSR